MAATVVLVNVNAAAWHQLECVQLPGAPAVQVAFKFEALWRAVLAFCNSLSFGFVHPSSRLALILYNSTESRLVWKDSGGRRLNRSALTRSLAQLVSSEPASVSAEETVLIVALSQALSLCNTLYDASQPPPAESQASSTGRVLVMEPGTASYASLFNDLLTLAFAAQKQRITIDVFSIGLPSSAVCQHLTDVSGGIHLSFLGCAAKHIAAAGASQQPAKHAIDGLSASPLVAAQMVLVFLQYHFAHTPAARALLVTPSVRDGALRSAICCCHQQTLENGRVCTCCLSIFCESFTAPICPVCRSRFRVDRKLTMATFVAAT